MNLKLILDVEEELQLQHDIKLHVTKNLALNNCATN